MFKVMKQVNDAKGTSRWSDAGPGRFPTADDAEKAMRRAVLATLRAEHREGYRSTRFRIAPVLAAFAAWATVQ